jgi:hypothetical protein
VGATRGPKGTKTRGCVKQLARRRSGSCHVVERGSHHARKLSVNRVGRRGAQRSTIGSCAVGSDHRRADVVAVVAIVS